MEQTSRVLREDCADASLCSRISVSLLSVLGLALWLRFLYLLDEES